MPISKLILKESCPYHQGNSINFSKPTPEPLRMGRSTRINLEPSPKTYFDIEAGEPLEEWRTAGLDTARPAEDLRADFTR